MKTIIKRFFLIDSIFERIETSLVPDKTISNVKIVRITKGISLLVGLIIAAISIFFASSCSHSVKDEMPAVLSQESLIKRGKYLVTTSACHDCHSPKIMTAHGPVVDTTRILSGHPKDQPVPQIILSNDWIMFNNEATAFVGPWGLSFAANLTPDDTGTGSWSFDHFKTAIRKGKLKGLEGSRGLLPPMPWEMYKEFNDDDLLAIFTYLRSIKPIDNLVPSPVAPPDLALIQTKYDNKR